MIASSRVRTEATSLRPYSLSRRPSGPRREGHVLHGARVVPGVCQVRRVASGGAGHRQRAHRRRRYAGGPGRHGVDTVIVANRRAVEVKGKRYERIIRMARHLAHPHKESISVFSSLMCDSLYLLARCDRDGAMIIVECDKNPVQCGFQRRISASYIPAV